MSTQAVTPETPAVSTDTPNSSFLPESKEYRRTGELPDEAVSQEREEKQESVQEDSSTAAASEAAEQEQEKGPERSKTAATSESRWAKLSRENRELRERLQRLEAEPPRRREVQQEPPPAKDAKANAEPQLEDVDENGKAKYATLGEYLAAHAKWVKEEAIREFQETSAKTQREQQQQEMERTIQKTVNERIQAIRKTHPDYDEMVAGVMEAKDDLGREAFFYTKGSHIDGFFLDSDLGHEIMYEIAKNPDDYLHIFARDERGNYLMNPVRQLRELAKIENSLEKPPVQKPAPRISQAPPPPRQVSANGVVAKDAVEDAVEKGDSDAYIREQNARILAARKSKGK